MPLISGTYAKIAILGIGLAIIVLFNRSVTPVLGTALYPSGVAAACKAEERRGAAGAHDGLRSDGGIRYFVRTPANYSSQFAHPLLMVYPSGASSGLQSETLTGLTTLATQAGFIVAYADSRPSGWGARGTPMSMETILELGTIPALVAKSWCVDADRIFLAGHSNGGTISTALSLLPDTPVAPAAITASAAGFTKSDLDKLACKKPMPVLVMHSDRDAIFPGYGRAAVNWWAACNGCAAASPPPPDAGGCTAYEGCRAATVYCEGHDAHGTWPDRNRQIIDFFLSTGSKLN